MLAISKLDKRCKYFMEYMQKGIDSLMQIIFHYISLYLENVIALLLVIKFYYNEFNFKKTRGIVTWRCLYMVLRKLKLNISKCGANRQISSF
jgi:hypothetical protein